MGGRRPKCTRPRAFTYLAASVRDGLRDSHRDWPIAGHIVQEPIDAIDRTVQPVDIPAQWHPNGALRRGHACKSRWRCQSAPAFARTGSAKTSIQCDPRSIALPG